MQVFGNMISFVFFFSTADFPEETIVNIVILFSKNFQMRQRSILTLEEGGDIAQLTESLPRMYGTLGSIPGTT